MARPPIEINWHKVEELCKLPLAQGDIAHIMHVSVDTLTRRIPDHFGISFAELQAKKLCDTKNMILTKQIELALQGNVTLLIWLGKNYCAQSESPQNIQLSASDSLKTLSKQEMKALLQERLKRLDEEIEITPKESEIKNV